MELVIQITVEAHQINPNIRKIQIIIFLIRFYHNHNYYFQKRCIELFLLVHSYHYQILSFFSQGDCRPLLACFGDYHDSDGLLELPVRCRESKRLLDCRMLLQSLLHFERGNGLPSPIDNLLTTPTGQSET